MLDDVIKADDLICIDNHHDKVAAPLAPDVIVERARSKVMMSVLY